MEHQTQVTQALMKPQAYPEDPGKIEMVQTHISFVFLTRNFAYKVKKAVNLGFLDFTTLERRLFFCQEELRLNKRLCDDMYLEVASINKSNDTIKIRGKGETVEYAVKMKRMPEDRIMTKLLDEDKVDNELIDKLAKIIAEFHAKAETNNHIEEFGAFTTIKTNWDENFEQTQKYVEKTIGEENFRLIQERINNFMNENKPLFQNRIAEGRVRDCHGDIHSGNIFVTDKIYIFDAVEVNERFRYSDVAADMAFLAMDLDFKGKAPLSEFFVTKYVEYSGDQGTVRLLPFYKCYRAYVRGKVIGFKLADPNIGDREKEAAAKEAKLYFKLAAAYARTL